VPYLFKCYYNTEHHCGNCGHIVARRNHDRTEVEALAMPEHLRDDVSQYPAAPAQPLEEQRRHGHVVNPTHDLATRSVGYFNN